MQISPYRLFRGLLLTAVYLIGIVGIAASGGGGGGGSDDEDVTASATITVDNITADDVVNAAEASGLIDVTGTVGGDAAAGDAVSFTVNGNDYLGTVVAGNTYSISVLGTDLENDTSFDITVEGTDNAGNPFSATTTSTHTVDTVASATISVNNITGDDIVNAAEASGNIDVTGSVGGDAEVGDQVSFTVNGSNFSGPVTAGNTFTITVPGGDLANDTSFDVTVTGSDVAGNPFTATTTSTHSVDLSASATISVNPITDDDIVNAAEASGNIDVTGSVGGDAEVGDQVSFTVNSNFYSGSVAAGNSYSISVAGTDLENDTSFDIDVDGFDDAGNPFTATVTSTHTVDTVASATISVDNITADDILDDLEAAGNVNVTGTVGGDAEPGDTVSFTVRATDYSGPVLAGNIFSIPVSGQDLRNDTSFDVTVEGSDDVGNPFTATTTSTHTIDTTLPITASELMMGFDIKAFVFSWTDAIDATYYRLLENPDGISGYSQIGADIAPGKELYEHIVALYRRFNASYILQTCNANGCTDSTPVNITGPLVDAIGYFKASNTDEMDEFGGAVSLSDDGTTLAVSATGDDSNATGINGDQGNASNLGFDWGAVYVFTLSGTTWAQQAYIKASNPGPQDVFGWSVSLSADGNTLAVGAWGESSNATGIDGNQADDSAARSGAVYIFTRSGSTWSQQAYIKASNTDTDDRFGSSISISSDGNTLAVGANSEDSNATGINGNQTDNSFDTAGAVYVFTRSGATWSQQAYVKASNTGIGDNFGWSVNLSGDGDTLAVGAWGESSNATGINGDQVNNLGLGSGAVYVFTRSGTIWTQQAYVKASNTDSNDKFGWSVSLNGGGNTMAVGARDESSNATGINGDQVNNSGADSGAVYVFTRSGVTWSQQAYVKASNTDFSDSFGHLTGLSNDGNTLAVFARGEESDATGINGDQFNNNRNGSGAVYIFTRSGMTWSQQAYVKASNTGSFDGFGGSEGSSIGNSGSLSKDGNTLAVGAIGEDSDAIGINGDQGDAAVFFEAGAVYLY